MQNNVNQTNQKDPDNRGQNGADFLPDELCSIWLGMVDVFQEEITSMLEGLPHLVWT